VLAIDLRAHGESEGRYSTAGYWERHDLNQVIDQFRGAHPDRTRQVVMFGVSLGGAVCAAAAVSREDLAAVILECPFADYSSSASRHGQNQGTPGGMFQRPALAIAQWIAGCDFSVVRPVDLIPKIPCPLIVIQSMDDPYLSAQEQKEIRAAVESRPEAVGPSVCWNIEEAHHVVGICADPEEYRRRLEEFLAEAARWRAEKAGQLPKG
jgi:pimeloyl-ACP methyl ester carboxylesterase